MTTLSLSVKHAAFLSCVYDTCDQREGLILWEAILICYPFVAMSIIPVYHEVLGRSLTTSFDAVGKSSPKEGMSGNWAWGSVHGDFVRSGISVHLFFTTATQVNQPLISSRQQG